MQNRFLHNLGTTGLKDGCAPGRLVANHPRLTGRWAEGQHHPTDCRAVNAALQPPLNTYFGKERIKRLLVAKDLLGMAVICQLVNQIVFNRVVGQFGVGFHVHFFQDAGAVGADGFHAECQVIGNF